MVKDAVFLHPSATTGNRHYRMTFDLRELPTRYDNGGGFCA